MAGKGGICDGHTLYAFCMFEFTSLQFTWSKLLITNYIT